MDRQSRLRQLESQRRADRRRILLLVAALALVLVVWQQVRERAEAPAEETVRQAPETLVALPEIERARLEPVEDATPEDRVVLEPEPFQYLARMGVALLPAHLRHLGEPAIPFDRIEEESETLRGEAYRVRGELLHAETLRRTPEARPEFWCWIRDDQGHDVFFVSLQIPETLFAGDNYVVADGWFYKIYTQELPDPETGERRPVTAPLLIGPELRPSWRRAGPATEPDPSILRHVVDAEFGQATDLNAAALWHLMNIARTRAQDAEWLERMYAEAPALDLDLLQKLAREPELYRGKAMIVAGRCLARSVETKAAGENPLRLDWVTDGYLGSTELGAMPVHVFAPEESILSTRRIRHYLAWFLQIESYTDKEGNQRRAPVFVTASYREVETEPAPFYYQILWLFLGLIVSLGVFLAWMIRRDRERARALARERRARHSPGAGPEPPREAEGE